MVRVHGDAAFGADDGAARLGFGLDVVLMSGRELFVILTGAGMLALVAVANRLERRIREEEKRW